MSSKLSVGVIQFPGSNCDHDALHAWGDVAGQDAKLIWHKDTSLQNVDVVFLPGGFSYGDYLRCGAIARFSPIMKEVLAFADKGGIVIGVCNGFQILLECGLLPGVMLRNQSLKFVCKFVHLHVSTNETIFTSDYQKNQVIKIPVAHGEGNYFTDPDTLKKLQDNGQIVFQYCDEHGLINSDSNPNGALLNIAGIVNEKGNVLGMMPHPERAVESLIGSADGFSLFQSIITQLNEKV